MTVMNQLNLSYIQKTTGMKKLILILFSVLVLFHLSCIPEKCCMPPQPSAHIMAEKNGVSWSSFYVKASISNLDSLGLTASATTDSIYPIGKLDSLNIKISYTGNHTYSLHSNQVFYATFRKGVTKSYKLDTTYNNVLNISGYEILHNPATLNPDPIKITGTFDLKFTDPENPAGISFTNGNFYTLMSQ